MNRVIFILTFVLAIGCKKTTTVTNDYTLETTDFILETTLYPDCFNTLTAPDIPMVSNCGSTFITAQIGNNKLITINLDEQLLGLKTTCKTFRFDTSGVNIRYYTHANHPDSMYFGGYPFCSDMLFQNQGQLITWLAVSGTVTGVISKEKAQRDRCENYRASVRLDNVKFIRQNSIQDTMITTLIIKDRVVQSCIP